MKEKSNKFIKYNIADFSKDVDVLRSLIRYQNCPRLINESVAEHSFFVAIYVLKLKTYYNFNLETALKMALVHDFPEAYISDIPHNIKKNNPNLAKTLEEIEINVTKERLSDEAADLLLQFNNGTTPEGLVCQLADIISVVLYAHDELSVGNKNFEIIAKKALIRVNEVISKLIPYINTNYTNDQIIDKINKIIYI